MKKFSKRSAFTLMEMLAVVVIIGIILTIAIPTVSNITNNRSKKLYKTHMTVVENATDLYIDQNKGQLINSPSNCFELDYQTLISDKIIKESDINCSGSIVLTKTATSGIYNKQYFLTCTDSNGDKVSKATAVPAGCIGFNAIFKIDHNLYADIGKTIPYDGTNYIKNAYMYLNSTSPYGVAITSYEYALPSVSGWTKITSGVNLGTVEILKNYSGKITVRAVDANNNKSDSASFMVKLDNTGPKFNTSIEGSLEDKTVTISGVVDEQIGSLATNPYSYDGGNTWINKNTYTSYVNTTKSVCVRDSLENTTCKNATFSGIDSQMPTIVAKQSTNYITVGLSKSPADYFTIKYGSQGGSVECTVTNVNQLPTGINTVTCTAKGKTNLTAVASTKFVHQYTATGKCSAGTLVNNNTCHFDSNSSVCGTTCHYGCDTTWNPCKTRTDQCKAGYTSECKTYSCTLYKSCTICTCNCTRPGTGSFTSGPNPNQSSFADSCVASCGSGISCSSGRQSGCGTETVTGSSCNNASSRKCIEYVYSSCATTENVCVGGNEDTNCSSCKSTTVNSCDKTEYLTYSCPTSGINSITGATITPTRSGSTCSF